MKLKGILVAVAMGLCLPGVSQARDTTHYLEFKQAVEEATAAGKLDGSVKFYWGTSPKGAQIITRDAKTSKKTNAFGKSDDAACNWVLQSALIHMQNAAQRVGANAVVNMVSNYNNVVYKSSDKYECHAGAIMAGVALKGDFAKVR